MALPTVTRTWVFSLNNRIVYTTLLNTMQQFLHGVKTFLKANGYTCKGSASAGVGAMDGVDRWTLTTDVTPRATVAAASQAWIVLTSPTTGIDILFAFQGATDDVCRISYSAGGVYVASGTPQNQPTATDETVDPFASASVINSGTGDRIWNGLVSTDQRACRFVIAKGGAWLSNFLVTGKAFAIETYTPTLVAPATGLPAANPTWMYINQSANPLPNGSQVGITRLNVANNVAANAPVFFGVESWPLNGVASTYPTSFGNEKPALQGSLGYPILPLSIGCNTVGFKGKMGNLIDTWLGRTAGDLAGDVYGTNQFIVAPGYIGTAGGGGVWPWDGATAPVVI
jgi:hypothetical protein